MPETFNYQDKRSKLFVDAVIAACSIGTSVYYQVSYRNLDRMKPLKDSGFVLLPNHQSNLDIVFEGLFLHKALGRKGYYLMKTNLPVVLEYLGGIKITRGKDIPKIESRDEKRREIELARERKEYVMDLFSHFLTHEEIIVMHSQGTRAYKKPFEVNRSNLKKFLDIQKRLGRQIPYVPLTISYEDISRPNSRVVLNAGNPIKVSDNGLEDLAEHLIAEIHPEFQ